MIRTGIVMVRGMKLITTPVLICLLLVLSMALGGIAAGRATGMAALEASLTRMVICAGGEGSRTVFTTRDGTPFELPKCSGMLCDSCLQAGSDAMPSTPLTLNTPGPATSGNTLPNAFLHHSEAVIRARSRAPPPQSEIQ
jgi:hypothetical protein